MTRVDWVLAVGWVRTSESVVELGGDGVAGGRIDDDLRDGCLVGVDSAVADEVVRCHVSDGLPL